MGGAKCSQPKIQFPWQYQHIWAIKDIQMTTPISLHPKPITLQMMPSTQLSQKDRLGLSKSRLVVWSLVLGGWQENNQVQLPLMFGWSLVMLPLWRRCDKWETERVGFNTRACIVYSPTNPPFTSCIQSLIENENWNEIWSFNKMLNNSNCAKFVLFYNL